MQDEGKFFVYKFGQLNDQRVGSDSISFNNVRFRLRNRESSGRAWTDRYPLDPVAIKKTNGNKAKLNNISKKIFQKHKKIREIRTKKRRTPLMSEMDISSKMEEEITFINVKKKKKYNNH